MIVYSSILLSQTKNLKDFKNLLNLNICQAMTVKLKTISTKYGQNLTLNMKKFDQCDLYKTIKLMNYIVLQKTF